MKKLLLPILFFAGVFVTLAAQQGIIEKPMVVIVPSYNNAQWFTLNLGSILNQNYSNFRVIYIDDCSTDGTHALVKQFVEQQGFVDTVTLICNSARRGALANLYSAIHSCDDHEIVVTVDGDDWLKNDAVLSTINRAYQDENVWLTHGHYVAHPDYNSIDIKELSPGIIQNNLYREWDWVTTHLRTFYAGLFKKIKLQDLMYDGNFFTVTWDMAMMLPMLEMAHGKIKRIHDILYVYNCATALNDFKTRLIEQIQCDKVIRSRKKYAPLHHLFDTASDEKRFHPSIILFAESPCALHATLESIQCNVHNINEISIICAYQRQPQFKELAQQFPSCMFYYVTAQTFKPTLRNAIEKAGEFIIMARTGARVKYGIDAAESAQLIDQTGAFGFYFCLGKEIHQNICLDRVQQQPKFLWLEKNVYAWQFKEGEYAWRTPFSCDFCLLRKNDIASLVNQVRCENEVCLEEIIKAARFDLDSVGLCCVESSVTLEALKQKENFEEEET